MSNTEKDLLAKHGICSNCGEMYSHHIDEPFASCKCRTAEWYELTPYMELEEKLFKIDQILHADPVDNSCKS